MSVFRKVALVLLLAALAGGLLLGTFELINHAQWASLPLQDPSFTTAARARLLESRVDMLTKRVSDMEVLVLILLGASGFYAVVFIISAHLSIISFARQADQTVRQMRDQISLAIDDLRPPATPAPDLENQVTGIAAGVAALQDVPPQNRPLPEYARLELIRNENTAACIAKAGGPAIHSALASLYLQFGRIYASADPIRSGFYLNRALRLATPQSPLASEIRYELACRFAVARDFARALRELAAAFEHQFQSLDAKLARDIEEGGKLFEMASTPPFERAVSGLLLKVTVGK